MTEPNSPENNPGRIGWKLSPAGRNVIAEKLASLIMRAEDLEEYEAPPEETMPENIVESVRWAGTVFKGELTEAATQWRDATEGNVVPLIGMMGSAESKISHNELLIKIAAADSAWILDLENDEEI